MPSEVAVERDTAVVYAPAGVAPFANLRHCIWLVAPLGTCTW